MAFKDLIPWQREDHKKNGEPVMISFQREMNRLFDDFFTGFEPSAVFRTNDFFPRVNVKEDRNNFTVSTELPGMDEKDVEITINENTLKICGEKKDDTETEKENYYYVERKSGYFKRIINLPSEVEADKAEATFKKGVLEIKIPKTEKRENIKKISIKKE
ncbi:Hsp20/alpha crystallin family protein [candidate division WOR-3 bacterium]|nr:Hsp20/alpha crystallin family protein [candidate division WOR-3 bacterium]